MNDILDRIPDGCFLVLFGDGSGATYDGDQLPTEDWHADWNNLDEMLKVLPVLPMSKDRALQLLHNTSLTLGERTALQHYIREAT